VLVLNPVDPALPVVRGRRADIEQRLRAIDRIGDVAGLLVGEAEQTDHLVADELIQHAVALVHRMPAFRIERGQHLLRDALVGRVAHIRREGTDVAYHAAG